MWIIKRKLITGGWQRESFYSILVAEAVLSSYVLMGIDCEWIGWVKDN